MSLLKVTGLSKCFGGLTAVDGVDLGVSLGEVVGLIGPNGAGKTTFVDLLTGTQHPTAGRIEFAGRDVTRLSADERCKLGLARTFQIPRPFSTLTIRQNVAVGALFGRRSRLSEKEAWSYAEAAIDEAGLGPLADKPVASLTTAGLKRLELARCLAAEPTMVFLDEPLGGLNATEVDVALDLVRKIRRRGIAIVFIEHIVSAVMAVSDRVVVLANGRKLAEGTPGEVLANSAVQRAYLGDISNAVRRHRQQRDVGTSLHPGLPS